MEQTMSGLDISPVTIKKGFVTGALSQGNHQKGTVTVDSLSANPADTFSCSSKLDISWQKEKCWTWGKSRAFRHVKVDDQDGKADLRMKIHQQGAIAEVSIYNGDGPNLTEIRFPLGEMNIAEENIARLESLRGSAIHIRCSKRLDEIRFLVSQAPCHGGDRARSGSPSAEAFRRLPIKGFSVFGGHHFTPTSTAYVY